MNEHNGGTSSFPWTLDRPLPHFYSNRKEFQSSSGRGYDLRGNFLKLSTFSNCMLKLVVCLQNRHTLDINYVFLLINYVKLL